jgi:hypothetical protein
MNELNKKKEKLQTKQCLLAWRRRCDFPGRKEASVFMEKKRRGKYRICD